uniref:RNA-binding protein EWS n=1 Tax=Mus spicilegus TaxID=10103 RepID=A0A8C6I3W9_MUSSI
MVFTDYSTYSQAAVQQGYSAYTAQPNQGYAQTTQAYGQQSYGTYKQPTDVSYTQAQTTATYGQTAYATSYGQPPTGYTTSTAPQAYSQLQVIIANRAAARGSRVHSNRTTPVAWVFMGKSLEDFPDQERTGA